MKTPDQFVPEPPKSARTEVYELSALQEAVETDFGVRIAGLTRLAEEEHGDNSQVFFGKLHDEKVFLKIGENPLDYEVEDLALRLFASHHIPSARVIGFKKESTVLHKAIMLQSAVPGVALDAMPQEKITRGVVEDAGRVLRQIHEIPLEGFGRLRVSDGKLFGRYQDYASALLNEKRNPEMLTDIAGLTLGEVDVLKRTWKEIAALPIRQGVFLHNDYHAEHIFSDGERITGIIDLAGGLSGDPRYDIAKAHYEATPQFCEWFDAGYGKLAEDPIVKKYELLVAANKVLYRSSKGFVEKTQKSIRLLKEKIRSEQA